ncbi:MAG: insulinase family protein [Myxococcales bacterium]|nr:insulinase family protein [Myxococcales bacterium]
MRAPDPPRERSPLRAVGAAAFVAAVLAATPRAAADPLDLPVDEHRLANGLRVVLAPDPTLGDVTVMVQYRVGQADDPSGLEGLAHLAEHLQFAGSKHVAAGEHARLLEAAGVDGFVGETSPDWTIYAETVPPSALALALWLESDRMAFPGARATDERVAHERTILSHEYESRVIDTALGPVAEVLRDQIYPAWHPYHIAWSGPGVAPAIGLRDVRAFFRTWYSPENAVLILAGAFDPAEALRLVGQYFGPVRSSPPPERPRIPAFTVGDVLVDVLAPVRQSEVIAAWQTPAYGEPGDRELDLAATLLAGPGAVLVRTLVRRGLATGVGARQASARLGSIFLIRVQAANAAAVPAIETAVSDAIAGLANGVDVSEFWRARHDWTLRDTLSLETSYGRAQQLALQVDPGDPWGLRAHERIDAAAVAAAVRQWLVPRQRAVLVVRPAAIPLPPERRTMIQRREQRLP